MSLWMKAQQLPPDSFQLQQIKSIYGDNFPIEVRHYLADYIEEKFWTENDPVPDNPQHEQFVAVLVNGFIQEIENKAEMVPDSDYFLAKLKLAEAARMFRQRYSSNPLQLFNYIRQNLNQEIRLIQSFSGDALLPNDSGAEIVQKMNDLGRRTQETAQDLHRMEQEQEAFELQYHDCTKVNAHIQHLTAQANLPQYALQLQKFTQTKDNLETELNKKIANLVQLRLLLNDKFKENIQQLNQIQAKILDHELINWKREQQLAGNGANFNLSLDTIQTWCEDLAELIWRNRQQIKEVDRLKQKLPLAELPNNVDVLSHLLAEVTQLLSTLVTSTFIIEKQPPQVMKTNTRFTATVRLLVGGKLNVHMTPPQVKVTIISESQANVLLKNDNMSKNSDCSGEILNNTGTMEYQATNRQLSVSFRNMQLKKIKRAEKKGTESVMDEKFSLLFQSKFSIGGGELTFQVWTLSLPVVVIVHGNQEPHAWATVTWDNAFSDAGRIPFHVPDKVMWSDAAEMLSLKFRAQTGRDLTKDNLLFLADKAFRGNFTEGGSPMLSWAQFCKEPLSERNFTFWEWFFAIMKLTREHLRGPWIDGLIMGFVKKRQAEEMLSHCPMGTFLLRFSDSELGGVTIAWLADTGEVFSLQPFTSKDFGIRSLADRIRDLDQLIYLYPHVTASKDSFFSKYYTPFQENLPDPRKYVIPLLVTRVAGMNNNGNFGNTTPQHSMMQSPDSSRNTPSVSSCTTAPAENPPAMELFDELYLESMVFDNLDDDIEYRLAQMELQYMVK